tara:strand:- start:1140 stop:1997 length:858 start_codon:yes stop_codon:yes gene_type:complete
MGKQYIDFSVPKKHRSMAMLRKDVTHYREKYGGRAGLFGVPRAAENLLTGRVLTYPWDFVKRQRNIRSMVRESELIKHGVLDSRIPDSVFHNSRDPRLTREQLEQLSPQERGRLTPNESFQAYNETKGRIVTKDPTIPQYDLKILKEHGYPYGELINAAELEALQKELEPHEYASGIGSLIAHKKALVSEMASVEAQMAREMTKSRRLSSETQRKHSKLLVDSAKVAALTEQYSGIINQIEEETKARAHYFKDPRTMANMFNAPGRVLPSGPEEKSLRPAKPVSK